MRKEFIEARTKKEARRLAPWADCIAQVDGGYYAFETRDDYDIWKRQQ